MHKKLLILIYIFTFYCLMAYPQVEQPVWDYEKLRWKKKLKVADRLFETGSYYNAIDYYKKVLEVKPENAYAAYKTAEANYRLRDYKQAEQYYKLTLDLDPESYPLARYFYAQTLKHNMKYPEAIAEFKKFAAKDYGDNEELNRYKTYVTIDIQGCEFAMQAVKDTVKAIIKHLDKNINAPFTEFGPLPVSKNELIYSSLRTDSVIILDKSSAYPYARIFKSTRQGNAWTPGELLPIPANSGDYHSGNGTYSPDRSRFYFTRCKETSTLEMQCEIYVTELKNGHWGEPQPLGNQINLPGYTSTHPNIGVDKEGSQTLYFVSNREGGYGGLDIWMAKVKPDGSFENPKNAGDRINTSRDEVTPFYHTKKSALYFSSNGHLNMGGFDVFKSIAEPGKPFSDPENIGYKLNSSVDDWYFTLLPGGDEGFFVSNRPGVYSLKSETCCDDIFYFKYQKIYLAVKGEIQQFTDENKKLPLYDATVTLIKLATAEGQADSTLKKITLTNKKSYFFNLKPDNKYKILVSKKGYLNNSATISTIGLEESDTLTANITLNKFVKEKAYKLENIYYDYNSYELRPESYTVLDTLYVLLKENPNIIIELSSHTDSRGSDAYNMKLSQKRAESCVNYLVKLGIDKSRLVPKGYGESKLLNHCDDGVECTEEEHQINRRTEFKIVGEVDAKIIYENQTAE